MTARPLIVFATCLKEPDIQASDAMLQKALEQRGTRVIGAPWNGDFSPFAKADLVLIRSTWDYFDRLNDFFAWLDRLKIENIRTENNVEILRWNARKNYLFELQDKGAPLMTLVEVAANIEDITEAAKQHGWTKAVLKCLSSGGALGMSVIDPANPAEIEKALIATKPYAAQGLMLQKFQPEITSAGEWSLVFFDGRFSHAVIKRPKPGDIRVQAVHGGIYERVTPNAETLARAGQVLSMVPGFDTSPPAYARVDGMILDGGFQLMELEMTEPELMFPYAPETVETMADNLLGKIS
jgi:glutathione synthetase-like protein